MNPEIEAQFRELAPWASRMVADPNFQKLVKVIERSLADLMLTATTSQRRDELAEVYRGLTLLVGQMQQLEQFEQALTANEEITDAE